MQSKKILRTIFLSLILLIITTNYTTKAKEKIRLYVNQEEITNASSVIINNRTYVPIRFVEEALGAKVKWNQEKKQVDINNTVKVIASIPEKNIYLYAINKKQENNSGTNMYKGLLLNINNNSKYYDWETIAVTTDSPILLYLDFTGDKKEELAIILSKGHGTGMSLEEIHIIDPQTFKEYKIENPLEAIKKYVTINISKEKKEVQIKIDNKKYNIETFELPTKIYYEDWISYDSSNNIIKCDIGVETNFLKYIGDIKINYSYKYDEFFATDISFE